MEHRGVLVWFLSILYERKMQHRGVAGAFPFILYEDIEENTD